jgi:hypothetical protein
MRGARGHGFSTAGDGQGLDVSALPRVEPGHSANARLEEHAREIWFRRRVRVIPALRELWSFRELIMTLAESDLRVRHRQAALANGRADHSASHPNCLVVIASRA